MILINWLIDWSITLWYLFLLFCKFVCLNIIFWSFDIYLHVYQSSSIFYFIFFIFCFFISWIFSFLFILNFMKRNLKVKIKKKKSKQKTKKHKNYFFTQLSYFSFISQIYFVFILPSHFYFFLLSSLSFNVPSADSPELDLLKTISFLEFSLLPFRFYPPSKPSRLIFCNYYSGHGNTRNKFKSTTLFLVRQFSPNLWSLLNFAYFLMKVRSSF